MTTARKTKTAAQKKKDAAVKKKRAAKKEAAKKVDSQSASAPVPPPPLPKPVCEVATPVVETKDSTRLAIIMLGSYSTIVVIFITWATWYSLSACF